MDFDFDLCADEWAAEQARTFAPGDVVTFSEWAQKCAGDPENTYIRFTGVVASVERMGSTIVSLSIDPASVTPKVHQQPRLTMAPSWYRAV